MSLWALIRVKPLGSKRSSSSSEELKSCSKKNFFWGTFETAEWRKIFNKVVHRRLPFLNFNESLKFRFLGKMLFRLKKTVFLHSVWKNLYRPGMENYCPLPKLTGCGFKSSSLILFFAMPPFLTGIHRLARDRTGPWYNLLHFDGLKKL